ncbi:MAG: alpha/beta fold hydrolase [Nitrososphaerota archaeon]
MEHIVSQDGTRIAYERKGHGPPLVLIHGTGIDHSYWDLVAPELERHVTVYTIDRRGRGQSGDTEPYAIQREFEDVAAIVGSIAGDVFLVGHSYGALCSLEAALLTKNIGKMILNEPPMYTTVEVTFPADAAARVLDYARAGEWEKALVLLYEAGGMSAAELNMLRSLPSWHARVQAAPTMLREILSVREYAFDPARFKDLRTPVLLLVGGETDPVYTAAMEALHAALPNSRLVVLSGQPHDAALTAPDLFVQQVLRFLLANDPQS